MSQPIISLPISYTSTTPTGFVTSGVWTGFPNEWQVTFTVTTQLHGFFDSPYNGFYDGTHVEVGDWVAINSGVTVQITNIISQSGSLVTAVVSDVNQYNINKSNIGEGLPGLGSGFIFKVRNNHPMIDPGVISQLAPIEYNDIVSRFALFAIELSSLSQFANDLDFLTEGSAITLIEGYDFITQTSAVDLIESFGYITEASALALINSVQQVSALSQLTNDVGYITEASAADLVEGFGFITEASADAAYEGLGDLSALSQFNNDVGYITEASAADLIESYDFITQTSATSLIESFGYITEASALALINSVQQVSALSQLTNDVGFITEIFSSAQGTGLEIISVSGDKVIHSTIEGGGIIEVSAKPDGTIVVSADAGSSLEIQSEGTPLTSTAGTINFVGQNFSTTVSSNSVTVTNVGPAFFGFRINMNAGGNIDSTTPTQDLPAGWSSTYINPNIVELSHNVGRPPINSTYFGFTVAGGYRGISGNGSFLYTHLAPATIDTVFRIFIQSAAQVLSEANGHVLVRMTF